MDYHLMKSTKMELALWRRKVATIIAMQGDPHTGKTTLAKSLAKRLKCQVIHFDEILDALDAPSTRDEAEKLVSVAFNILAQVIKVQTSSGDSVIIDSPLSRRSHLQSLAALDVDVEDALSRLARDSGYMEDDEAHQVACRLIIIECKPKYNHNWETQFSNQLKWYNCKPQEPLLDNKSALVSKLVIDTTDFVQIDDVVDVVRRLTYKADKGKRIELSKEREERYRREGPSSMMYGSQGFRHSSCSEQHVFRFYKEASDIPVAVSKPTCKACQKEISDLNHHCGVYICWSCGLAIHKSCAELGAGESARTRTSFSPQDFHQFLKIETPPIRRYMHTPTPPPGVAVASFNFPNHYPCESCNRDGKAGCNTCLFDAHLKCQKLPTILHHLGHNKDHHHLFFWLSTTSSKTTQYQCVACRRLGDYASYRCNNRACDFDCHPQCALLPLLFFKHKHGGHVHDLGIMFQRWEEFDEYLCTLCSENMHPKAWYYSCQTCEVELHLECAFKDFDA